MGVSHLSGDALALLTRPYFSPGFYPLIKPRASSMFRGRFLSIGLVLSLTLTLTLTLTAPSFAWGPRGHRVASRIAEGRLTPAASKAVRELLLDGDTLVDICNWADHEGHDVVPASAPWHYVNVPIDAAKYDAKYCGGSKGCVVAKIHDFRRVLADKKTPIVERRRALLFLVHFIEDIHQPLHVGDNRDRGGNDTQVQWFGQGDNMHRIWDSGIIEHEKTTDRAWVDRAGKHITPANLAAWSKDSTPESWANESLTASKSAYFFPKGSKKPIQTGALLGKDYIQVAEPIVEERLAQAGVRLAEELNAIFSANK